jgi:hypothetical protein
LATSVCAHAQRSQDISPIVELQWHESRSNADKCAVIFADHTYHARWVEPTSERGPHFGTGHLNDAQAGIIQSLLKPGIFQNLPSHDGQFAPAKHVEWLAVRLDRRGLEWRKNALWFDRDGKSPFPPEFVSLRQLLDSIVKEAAQSDDLLPDVCLVRMQPLAKVVSP